MTFSVKDRTQFINQIPSEIFDICIIGGGITGAGVARDAASRGMKVCVIEQGDFASGTSSRSSKLIHGGIRYLENLEFGLVFEALNERHLLFQIAPHLVHPLSFLLPVYEGGRVGMFKMGLGMWLYDALALFHAPKFHEKLSSTSTTKKLPALRGKGLEGSYLYSDAYMDDDRLVLETLRSARVHGAVAVNYAQVKSAQKDSGGRVTSLEVEDLISGNRFNVKAKHFVSTTGPWTDIVGEKLLSDWKKLLRPSKGIHLVIHSSKLPTEDAVVMATDNEKRIIFAIPRGNIVIVGTTDTDYPENPEAVKSDIADVDYLIKIVNSYFPGAAITKADIISSYAGVRPLVYDGSHSESKTSREHVIKHTPHNMTFVAGGKYTTYRRMARDIMEVVLKEEFSTEERIQFARNQTRDAINPLVTPEKLSVSLGQAPIWAKEFGVTEDDALSLTRRHGYEAYEILQTASVKNIKDLWAIEALHAARHTMCLHLRDFMLRRTPLYLTMDDHGQFAVDSVVNVLQSELGWSDAKVKEEIELYQTHIRTEMAWKK